jgi:hypothetical protein
MTAQSKVRGVPASPSGSHASHGTGEAVSAVPVSIPNAVDMLTDDVSQIVQRLPYLEVAPARMFTPGLLSELADASDRLAAKVAKLTEAHVS